MTKKTKKFNKTFNLRVVDTIIDSYQEYCNKNGYVLSTRIRFLIEKDMENKIQINK